MPMASHRSHECSRTRNGSTHHTNKTFEAMRFIPDDCRRMKSDEFELCIRALNRNDPITNIVTLAWSHIGDHGCNILATALRQNRTLRKLDLYMNDIGKDGAVYLGLGLETNTTLRELSLDWNNIGEDGAKEFAVHLQRNTCLTKLSLQHNKIGQEGIDRIENIMERNKHLKPVSQWELLNMQSGNQKNRSHLTLAMQREQENAQLPEGPSAFSDLKQVRDRGEVESNPSTPRARASASAGAGTGAGAGAGAGDGSWSGNAGRGNSGSSGAGASSGPSPRKSHALGSRFAEAFVEPRSKYELGEYQRKPKRPPNMYSLDLV